MQITWRKSETRVMSESEMMLVEEDGVRTDRTMTAVSTAMVTTTAMSMTSHLA